MAVERRVRALIVVVEHEVEVVVGRVIAPTVDLRLVDALARLQVVAQRRGSTMRLRDVCPELLGLLRWAGLDDALLLEADR